MLFLLLFPMSILRGELETKEPAVGTPPPATRQFSYADGILLGLVEGFTEFLPVSSTGHLILTSHFLGLDSNTPIKNDAGDFVMARDRDGTKVPLTLARATYAYSIIIQFGAILAVVFIYWHRISSMIIGLSGKDPNGLRLLRNLIVSFLPAAVIGLLLEDFIESFLFGLYPVAIALFAGSIFIWLVAHAHAKKHPRENSKEDMKEEPDLNTLSIKQCLIIGFLQCIALWPGTSRSMMTIVGGYLVGLSPARAAEYSFLLGLLTLSSASAYKGLTVGPPIIQALNTGPALLGILVATVSAAFAVTSLVRFLNKYGLSPFAWYRIGLSILILLIA